MTYEKRDFKLPRLQGISSEQIEIHLGLYAGYVKFTNQLCDLLADLGKDPEKNSYALGEVRRRFGWEFDGMRMHEYYFEQWENGARPLPEGGPLARMLTEQYGSFSAFEDRWKRIGQTRGIGWTVLAWDPRARMSHAYWVGEHELGQLAGLPIVLVMDMWEHAYMADYKPADKKKYIDAFWQNLDWQLIEQRFTAAGQTAAAGRGTAARL
jgi:Fe-Mn family superoxide dismutase